MFNVTSLPPFPSFPPSFSPPFNFSTDLPVVRFISPATYVEVGRSFVLNCTISGPPSTTLRWYHNTTVLPNPNTPGVQISPSGFLTVSSAAVNHSGEYTCNASTSYAYSAAHVTVIVGSKFIFLNLNLN